MTTCENEKQDYLPELQDNLQIVQSDQIVCLMSEADSAHIHDIYGKELPVLATLTSSISDIRQVNKIEINIEPKIAQFIFYLRPSGWKPNRLCVNPYTLVMEPYRGIGIGSSLVDCGLELLIVALKKLHELFGFSSAEIGVSDRTTGSQKGWTKRHFNGRSGWNKYLGGYLTHIEKY